MCFLKVFISSLSNTRCHVKYARKIHMQVIPSLSNHDKLFWLSPATSCMRHSIVIGLFLLWPWVTLQAGDTQLWLAYFFYDPGSLYRQMTLNCDWLISFMTLGHFTGRRHSIVIGLFLLWPWVTLQAGDTQLWLAYFFYDPGSLYRHETLNCDWLISFMTLGHFTGMSQGSCTLILHVVAFLSNFLKVTFVHSNVFDFWYELQNNIMY